MFNVARRVATFHDRCFNFVTYCHLRAFDREDYVLRCDDRAPDAQRVATTIYRQACRDGDTFFNRQGRVALILRRRRTLQDGLAHGDAVLFNGSLLLNALRVAMFVEVVRRTRLMLDFRGATADHVGYFFYRFSFYR